MSLWRRKPVADFRSEESGLARELGSRDLILLGIGAVVGAGIFILTGVAAATEAGPAVVLSFVIAGIACTFAALSYSELAAAIGGPGSAYGYAYAGFGEFIAWLIGWDLILEYALSVSAVAVGWGAYVVSELQALGISLPQSVLLGPREGGLLNLPAVLVVVGLGFLLAIGIRASARFNAIVVSIKLVAIAVFVSAAISHTRIDLWQPFMPFGWAGVVDGAALVFFAFIGFDAVSTAASETRNPQRDLPRGIIGSLAICTALYVVVAALLTLIAPYQTLNVASPVSAALLAIGANWAAAFVAAGAIAGLTSVMLVSFYGQTRIFFAMSRDGLLPGMFGEVDPRTRTPVKTIALCGISIALLAGLLSLEQIVELVNIGTLAAFVLVCGGVIVLRKQQPELERPFKTPFSPLIPALGILSCTYLMAQLPAITWLRFVVWMAVGLAIYFGYARHHSVIAERQR